MRNSAYPTIESATDAASSLCRDRRQRLCVIADQPGDGGFTLTSPEGCDADAVYMNVDADGRASEGPKAKELPIGFTGALPH